MELVTGAMGSLLPKLGELLKEEYGLQKGVRKKIETLSRELEAAHAVLRKIGDVPPEQLDELVKLWVRDVREASYDMEDIVDTFLVRVDEPADPHRLRRLRKKVGGLFKKSKARRRISCLIQEIYEKLDEVAARRGRYTVDSIVAKPAAAATTIDPRILNLFKRATELVGIERPRDELINMLSLGGDVDEPSNKKATKVISVVGFGGLGKTTLAKAVYDQLKPHFDRSAFVPVGRNPDVKKVLRDILIDLDKGKYANSDLMVLDEKQLMEFVKKKRCFIVIDDIWDKESWKLIRCALQDSHCGSRVVVTTRTYEVAAQADEEYKIKPLSRANSEKLLYARIADGEGKYFDSPSADACDKVLKKCGGVPLAIITMASLLAKKPGEDWSEVYNAIGFGQRGNDYVDNTRKILSFSYYDLPSHLKLCLLYLSIFSEDQLIRKNTLIWMWVAERFVQEEQAEGIGLFELGERYFNELINRSMIQPVERFAWYVDCCHVHDMVFNLVRSLSSQENFVTVLDGDDERQKLPGSIARRIALHRIKQHNSGQLLANIDMDKIRSFIASECNFGQSSCPRTPVLRVLDMQNCYAGEKIHEGMLDHLGNLLHLRYLHLESSVGETNIKLPSEVRYLKFLQTLDLWKFRIINELPEEVGLLTQLVCLRVGPRTRIPDGLIGKLTSLQELVRWPPDDDDYDDATRMQFVKELGMLRELRVLWTKIHVRDESMVRALLESLGNLHNIRMMHIAGDYPLAGDKSITSHEGLITCCHLQFLYLDCLVFSGLPKWIKSSLAPNLSYLYMRVQAVKEQDMETLARLPELRSLTLSLRDETKLVNIKIPCTAQGVGYYFGKLRILKIDGAPIWFDLRDCISNDSVASAIMPSLESLEFKVNVRFLKDAALLSFGRLLGFESLGRTSLQRVTVTVDCEGVRILDMEDVEDALERTATVHPKRPNLRTTRQQEKEMLSSTYQEARMEVSRTPDFVLKAWKSANIVDSGHIRVLRIPPDPEAASTKVLRLLYLHKGKYLLTLSSDASLKLWTWGTSEKNPRGRPTTSVPPLLWQPKEGILMKNDTTEVNTGAAAACIALSKNESYIISAYGGKVSLFNAKTFKVMTTFMEPPPASTFLTFYPQDNNIIAIGMEDSSIQIYNVRTNEVQRVLMGHQKKVTGLTFSQLMNVLVSSGADAQLCVWSTDNWEKKKSRYIQPPSNDSALVGDTMVQFHYDQTHLLVVHESQLAIYDGNLECLHSWSPRDPLPSPISSAVHTSNGLLVYAGFRDGAIGIFEAESLRLQCRIAPSAYIPSSISSGGGIVYPVAVSVYPWLNPNQITLGMSDGAVHLLEPLED